MKMQSNRILLVFVSLIINVKLNVIHASTTPNESDGKNTTDNGNCNTDCFSSTCAEEVFTIQSNMDPKIDPCDDFYEFVCGNFSNKKVASENSSAVFRFKDFQKKLQKSIFNEIIANIEPNDTEAARKTKRYFQSCMNETHIEEESVKSFLEIIEKLGGWPMLLGDDWKEINWEDFVYKSNSLGFKIDFPFTMRVVKNRKNNTENIIRLSPASTLIPLFFYLKKNNSLNAHFGNMVEIATELGANKTIAVEHIMECLQFENNLTKIKMMIYELSSNFTYFSRMTINDLSENYPDIPWSKLLIGAFNSSNVFIDEKELVEIENLNYFQNLSNLLINTPKRVLVNYQIWQLTLKVIHTMPKNISDKQSNFFVKIGKRKSDREAYCLNEVMNYFDLSINSIYFKKYNIVEKVPYLFDITNNLKNEFKNILETIDWMDENAKNHALTKLDDLILFSNLRIPNETMIDEYYKDLDSTSESYLNNTVNIFAFLTNKEYESLRKPDAAPLSIFQLETRYSIVTPYYVHHKNSIEIPYTILSKLFLKGEGLEYLNYGMIGSMIGSVLLSGYDIIGSKYDRNGNYVNWWNSNTTNNYMQKAKCLFNSYNDNFTKMGRLVSRVRNSFNSFYDIIRSIGGSQLAYQAYNKWKNQNNITESCLPGYTSNQMFWISAATYHCQRKSENLYLNRIVSPKAFFTLSFSNSRDFARDFNCKVNTTMNPEKMCDIW